MDEIQVINSAYALLGHTRITSLSDGSEAAVLAGLRFSLVRDAVLEEAPWNFATIRKALARSERTPAMDWDYQYPLPTNPYCIKVRDTYPAENVAWEVGLDEIDERILMTNQDSIKIRYTARVVNLNIWSPLAVMALTYLLASDLALSVTGQKSKSDQNLEKFAQTLAMAKSSDAREGTPLLARAPITLTGIR